ncbi:DciA family protein [Chitinimonas taiwanensis]|uniref:DciA family protein n=1 Tax=Chitinimonas taiwanensis TaxID=240412 RepID=UPI0035B3C6E4
MSLHNFRPLLSSPELARLQRLAAAQRELERLWQAAVPAELVGLSSVVNLEGDCLQVATRSPALMAKFKQMEARLLVQLNDVGVKINAIRWRVQVELLPHQRKKAKPNLELSEAALQAFEQATQRLQPSPLRDALAEIVAKRRKSTG